jgi:hypothetical protein
VLCVSIRNTQVSHSDSLQQLEYGEHDIIDVAKSRRLALLGVMQAAAPVDRHVTLTVIDAHGAVYSARAGGVSRRCLKGKAFATLPMDPPALI